MIKYLKNREKIIAQHLKWWNENKFRESFKVEWSVGMFGSYIEIACMEGRPLETINYCFPPDIENELLAPADKVIFENENKVNKEPSELQHTRNIALTRLSTKSS